MIRFANVPEPRREEPIVILIADDESFVLDFVRRALTTQGYELLLASDGTEALAICKARIEPIHLAILDIVMPGMDGVALLHCLRELYPNIRALFTSGCPVSEVLQQYGVLPTDGEFMQKPFTGAELQARVQEELSKQPRAGSASGF